MENVRKYAKLTFVHKSSCPAGGILTEQQALEEAKADIGWGSQIRSYVLDQSRIKDLRTGVETGNTQAVLDGDLDQFIEAGLKQGL